MTCGQSSSPHTHCHKTCQSWQNRPNSLLGETVTTSALQLNAILHRHFGAKLWQVTCLFWCLKLQEILQSLNILHFKQVWFYNRNLLKDGRPLHIIPHSTRNYSYAFMRAVYCTGKAYAVAAQQFHTERCCCIVDLYIIIQCKLTLLCYFTVNPVHYAVTAQWTYILRYYCRVDLYTTLLLHSGSIHYAVSAQWIYTLRC